MIEHAHIVRPGSTSYLTLKLKGRDLHLRCRVVRSVVHRVELEADGERVLIYRTGLEYLEPSEETRQKIDEYITATMEGLYPPFTGP